MTDAATHEPTPGATRWSAFGAAVTGSGHALHRAWAWEPSWVLRLVLVYLANAVAPAIQVLAVGWLVRRANAGAHAYWMPLLALAAAILFSQTCEPMARFTMQRVRMRLQRHYQLELMQTSAAMSPQQLASPDTTALVQACRDSLMSLGEMVCNALAAVAALVTAVTLSLSVWSMSRLAGLLVVVALVPQLVVFAWEAAMQERLFADRGHWLRRAGYRVEQLVTQRSATELATLGSGAVVARMADDAQERADGLLDRILVLLIRGDAVGAVSTSIVLAGALAGIVVGGGGGAGVAAGIVGVLSGMSATLMAGFAYGELMMVAPKLAAYRSLVGSVDRETQQHITAGADALEVSHVSVTYPGADHAALVDFSLSVRRGQMVALVGVNGAGKTTAVNAILGIVDRDHSRGAAPHPASDQASDDTRPGGSITLDGVDLDQLSPTQRLSRFGVLQQEFGRYEFTVRDAVRIGRPDGLASDAEIWRALASAHAEELVQGLPDGLDTQLGPQFGGVGLSGGQWQRLALARIHLRGAPVWILDEPTSAIDAEAEAEVFSELARSKDQRITIVVSHRAWTLRGMDLIVVLDHGRIVEQGSFDHLLGARGRFAEIFAEQV